MASFPQIGIMHGKKPVSLSTFLDNKYIIIMNYLRFWKSLGNYIGEKLSNWTNRKS